MGKLTYLAITSLDGYIEDVDGGFEWAEPDVEVHDAANELMRGTRTQLCGRRMYEVMAVWQTMGLEPDDPPVEKDFAEAWRATDKVVYSRTLDDVWTPRTRLEREFDPEAARAMKAADGDVSVSGPGLAQHAFEAGLVDEVHLFVNPVIVGGGKPGLPSGVRLDLELVDERRFVTSGVVYLRYVTR